MEEVFLESNFGVCCVKVMYIMCFEGDVEGIMDLLCDVSEDEVDVGDLICF